MTPILDRINLEDVMMTAVQNLSKCNANTFAIDRKLREARILDADETLKDWLWEMMPQVTDGGNITVPELLAGLKQFLEFE